MEERKIEISDVKLKIGNTEIELNMEEIGRLRDLLNAKFGNLNNVPILPIPYYPYPCPHYPPVIYENNPFPDGTWTITCGGTSDAPST